MRINTILELVSGIQLQKDVLGVTLSSCGVPMVTLKPEAFLETFQTFEETPLPKGKLVSCTFCNVQFTAVIFEGAD